MRPAVAVFVLAFFAAVPATAQTARFTAKGRSFLTLGWCPALQAGSSRPAGELTYAGAVVSVDVRLAPRMTVAWWNNWYLARDPSGGRFLVTAVGPVVHGVRHRFASPFVGVYAGAARTREDGAWWRGAIGLHGGVTSVVGRLIARPGVAVFWLTPRDATGSDVLVALAVAVAVTP